MTELASVRELYITGSFLCWSLILYYGAISFPCKGDASHSPLVLAFSVIWRNFGR
jgi:hypothetical protein